MIYHSAVFQANQDRLKHFAIELAEQLIPKGKILTSQANDDSIHFVVQTGSILAGFEFHVKELSASALQGILKVLADLELTRKNGGHLQLKEIKFYILAPSFSQDFLNQIPTSWQGIRLVEWSFIRSDSSEGMFIREIEAPTFQKKTTEKNDKTERIAKRLSGDPKEEWSTPELIAFARLGIELRNQSLRHYCFNT